MKGCRLKAVLKIFVQMHRDGLIYRDGAVNTNPKLQTAISDLEAGQ